MDAEVHKKTAFLVLQKSDIIKCSSRQMRQCLVHCLIMRAVSLQWQCWRFFMKTTEGSHRNISQNDIWCVFLNLKSTHLGQDSCFFFCLFRQWFHLGTPSFSFPLFKRTSHQRSNTLFIWDWLLKIDELYVTDKSIKITLQYVSLLRLSLPLNHSVVQTRAV